MKISVRLTLYSIMVIAITIFLCCAILLLTTANNQINNTVDSGAAELRMLNNSFNAEMEVLSDDTLSDTARQSLVLHVFRKYASASVSGAHYILTDGQNALYNDCPIDPRPLLRNAEEGGGPEKEKALPHMISELDGRQYLSVGYGFAYLDSMTDVEYELYLVRDITDVYENIAALGARFAIIACITIFIGAMILLFFIRRTLRPLADLQNSAAALADGQYNDRITVCGQDEITELAINFNKMAEAVSVHIEALENTAEQRKLLLSALTHELKTPMTAIIGYSESLMRVNLNQEQKEKSIAYIHKECKRLERLAQKMMRFITIHDGEAPNISAQPVSALYAAVEPTLSKIAEKESLSLSFQNDGAPVFQMDVDMLTSVLINLFDNARKAGAKHISILAGDSRISVTDDGAGIPADEIKNITQPFYMVDKSHSQSIGGSGLGLALCELIITAHHARLSIESEEGVGTTVHILFDNSQVFTS